MRPALPKQLAAWLQDPRVLLGIYAAAAIIATLQKVSGGTYQAGGLSYPPFQNYVIFRNAFGHLLAGRDLYAAFPLEQADLFKYSPTFALLIAPIAALPYTLGAVVWNLGNATALFGAVMWVPTLNPRARTWVLWFVLLSLVSSMQSAQSNGLMAGLMLAGFAARERSHDVLAALGIVLAAFVKPFGLVALLPCLARSGRGRFLACVALWVLVLGLAPLAIVSVQHLASLYQAWWYLMQHDLATRTGTSAITWLRAWFGLAPPKTVIVAVGGLLLLLPFAKRSLVADAGARLLLMASVLIWVVIFNHTAEPPTYVIAVLGVALWYFSRQPTVVDTVLLAATFGLTCLAATDVYPRSVRVRLISRYVLRAVPCIFVWLKLQYDLLIRGATARTQSSPD